MVSSERGQRAYNPYIFFDLGNTLLYYQGDRIAVELEAYHALLNSLKNNGIKLPSKIFLKRFQKAMQQYYKRRESTLVEETTLTQLQSVLCSFGYDHIPQLVLRKALDRMYFITEGQWQLDPETIPCLNWLSAHGFRLGLISNASDATNVFRLLHLHNLYGYFSTIIISGIVGYRKPHTKVFEAALNGCGNLPREHIYMVGDLFSTDILGGYNVGLRTVWLSKHAEKTTEQEKNTDVKADLIFSGLELLRSWMEEHYTN